MLKRCQSGHLEERDLLENADIFEKIVIRNKSVTM